MNELTCKQRSNDNAFEGFESLDANFIYCPNQFIDVCLPNCSRGAIRVLAFMINETLGFLGSDGNPVRPDISFSQSILATKANVSRSSIGKILHELTDKQFIECTRPARMNAKGEAAVTGSYMLRWGSSERYIKQLDAFDGFYDGEGCRTRIPKAYFTRVIPNETAAVIRVTGVVIRHTIGYAARGGRRDEVDLSYSDIQRYTNISDRTTLSNAIKTSIHNNYVSRVVHGRFHHDSNQQTRSRFRIKWLASGNKSTSGSKTRPAIKRPENQTSNDPKSRPDKRFKNQTSSKANSKNQNNKQSVVDDSKAEQLLLPWFDRNSSRELLAQSNLVEIQNQIAWLPFRNAENPAGMLRRAIEQSWPEPEEVQIEARRKSSAIAQKLKYEQQAKIESADRQKLTSRKNERERLLRDWRVSSATDQANARDRAIKKAKSATVRKLLTRSTSDQPHFLVLQELQRPTSTS